MEEFVMKFGFVIVCVFFFLTLLIGDQFFVGVGIGLALTLFGAFFRE